MSSKPSSQPAPQPAPDPTPGDPDALLQRWQEEDDRGALGELLLYEMTMIKRHLRAKGRDGAGQTLSPSDFAQEAVIRLLNQFDQREAEERTQLVFKNPGHMRGYLIRIAWNLLIDRYRQVGRKPLRLDETTSQDFMEDAATTGGLGRVEDRDLKQAIELSINLLSPKDQEILTLYCLEDRDLAEITEILGLPSRDAARVRKNRAMEHLAPILQRWWKAMG